jgi:predicted dehydrogenase
VRVAIVGCGLIGRKRAMAIRRAGDVVVAVVDPDLKHAAALAAECSATALPVITELGRDVVDAVVVATPHRDLYAAAAEALELGCNVLVEKPAARTTRELLELGVIAERQGKALAVGFNHRFNPAFTELRGLTLGGDYGRVMAVRARYGHGGRIGYATEWRADPWVSGGGELIDQGFHLIDLSREILGELPVASTFLATVYWDMPVDDSAVVILGDSSTKAGPYAVLHATCAEWKNTFEFEVWCERAKFRMRGLQGSYGRPVLDVYRMLPEMGPPELEVFEFPDEDQSWLNEWVAFSSGKIGSGGVGDVAAAAYAHRIADQAYGDVAWRQ